MKLETVCKIIKLAGKKIMEFYDKQHYIEDKGGMDSVNPLTEADIAANTILLKMIKEVYPKDSMLSEEEKDDKTRLQNSRVWIIDPLDGTKEFIKRNGEFTVNIGLVEDGKPVLGVISVPANNEVYSAEKGKGAWHQKGDSEPQRITVSERDKFQEMILIKSRSHASPQELKIIEKIGFSDVKTSGSSVKGCKVASGEADIYYRFGRTMEWDICAMHAIINEAGGKMTDLQGEEIIYNKENPEILGFIASNNKIHEKFVRLGEKID